MKKSSKPMFGKSSKPSGKGKPMGMKPSSGSRKGY